MAIHAASPRAERPMISVNCSTIAANLLDSVIFGHEEGAFAGAFERRIGQMVEAHGSTLFLDEVSGMPPETQARLLDMLQTGAILPLGARHAREVDVRIIAASDVRLVEAVEAGRFREDLYYKLNVTHVAVPPLRERPDDIAALTRHLLTASRSSRACASSTSPTTRSTCSVVTTGRAMSASCRTHSSAPPCCARAMR